MKYLFVDGATLNPCHQRYYPPDVSYGKLKVIPRQVTDLPNKSRQKEQHDQRGRSLVVIFRFSNLIELDEFFYEIKSKFRWTPYFLVRPYFFLSV